MNTLAGPFFAAVSASEWLAYPILRIGDAEFTLLTVLKRVALLEVAAADRSVLHEPAPAVYFDGFGDSALNFAIERKLRRRGSRFHFPSAS